MSSKSKITATKEDGKPALVPKLRFPEFREAEGWKSKTLGQMGTFIRGLTYTPGDVADKGLLVLRSGNIQDGSLVFDKDLVFVEKKCNPDLLLKGGDVVICMSNGSKALVGKSGEYRQDYGGEVTIGAFCSLYRAKNPFSKIAFRSEQYSDFIADSIMGGNINNLKNSTLEGFPFPVPQSNAEQQKIAECLSSVDELIAAQARKLDALKTHKKGLMQQLFPCEGETQPHLRFPEFQNAGEWREEKLDELLHFQDGFSFKSTAFVKSKEDATQVIRITDINNQNTNGDKVYIPSAFLESNKLGKYSVNDGDLLLSLTGAAGFNFFFWDGGPATINQRTAKVTAKKKSNRSLLRLLEPLIHEKINARGEGQNNNLSKEFLSSIVLVIPEPDEQQRIADCLTSLDDLIAAQTQKHEALKTHKKGLMQQLFPSPEEE
jgi:type I restriction enzyme, S subunit